MMIIAGYSSKEGTFRCTVWTCMRSDFCVTDRKASEYATHLTLEKV